MVFSALSFLFCFLPLTAGLYYLCPNRIWRNAVLLAASLVFYSWGEPRLIVLMLAAAVTGRDAVNGFKIWKRDRYCHASPNSAQTESTAAGILHVRLAGPASYFGKEYEKPYIGDPDREITDEDILTTNRLFVCASWAGVLLLLAVRLLITRCIVMA